MYGVTLQPELRLDAIRSAAVEPLRAGDVCEVLDRLASKGIAAPLLKGTPLAYGLYGSPDHRPRGDTDLLVSPADLKGVREALRAAGFEEQLTSGDEHGVRQMFFTRVGTGGLRHSYDVHWSAVNSALFACVLDSEGLRERAVPLDRLGPHARTLATVDALLLACVHRVAHHYDSQRLIWLADIVLLRERMSADDQRTFWQRAAEARIVGVCERSIQLAGEWFLHEMHDLAKDWLPRAEIERGEASRRFLNPEIRYGEVMAANLRALPWRARLTRLRQLAFPPAQFMAQSFGSGSRMKLPFFYAWRAFRGLGRLFRRTDT